MESSSTTSPPLFGKTVKDAYGYTMGKVILIKEENLSKYILIEGERGDLISYPSIWLKPDGEELILLSPLKFKAEKLIGKIHLIRRKNKILQEISAEKDTPIEELSEIEKCFKEGLNRLKSDGQIVLKDIDSQINKCKLQIKELNSALVYLKIELGMNTVDRDSLLEAKKIVKKGIERIELEKKDLEELQKGLNDVILGETLEASEEVSSSGVEAPSKQKDAELVVRIEGLGDFETKRINHSKR